MATPVDSKLYENKILPVLLCLYLLINCLPHWLVKIVTDVLCAKKSRSKLETVPSQETRIKTESKVILWEEFNSVCSGTKFEH